MTARNRAMLPLLIVGIFASITFVLANQFKESASQRTTKELGNSVLISAPVQILMYAGDRYLAANFETMRIAAIGPNEDQSLTRYRIRAHRLVSTLNPCDEDNYYLANAMLSWGGAAKQSNNILKKATKCRFWDEFPPFFLGFNRYFFNKDLVGAKQAINIAAQRSKTEKNKRSYQRIVIAIEARKLNDERMAVSYLRNQRNQTKDKKLAQLLDRRLKRLEGLLTLRNAQMRFEEKYDKPLRQPIELINSGILQSFPQDPMKIGYEFVNGQFRLGAINIGGIEVR